VKTKKRTEVTIEVDEIVIRKSKQGTLAWCDRCAENVRVLEADGAAALAGTSSQAIYREVEAGRVHFVETEGGSILVCLDSLSRVAAKQLAQGDPRPPD
jgi:hypothetical protein